jgi:hypothetical protein
MSDYTIKAQFEAACSPDEVKKWLDNPAGIAGWWSDRVEGAAGQEGDEFHVSFPSTPVPFELLVTDISDRAIEWEIPASPPWWKGTSIRFELTGDDGKTKLLFTHRGFDPADPIIEAITPAWVRFLDNLVVVAESGKANPAVIN